MAATGNLPDRPQSRKSLIPSHGVVTLYGYGISVQVDRGHLLLKDGIGSNRREVRFPRIGHGLRRLVVIGADGFVSLAGLRWLADQDAAFVMLERDGSVLATTGPVRPSDARLRRAQALAYQSGIALRITRELISQKLVGQEQLARRGLENSVVAGEIAKARIGVNAAKTIETIRQLEARAALAYWSAWRDVPVNFPTNDLRRVPDHWRSFGVRRSPITSSPRLAVNPLNAILNYLYAILESEARLAIAALGLDPGLGVLHADAPSRDNLACDLMEPVRPQVDAYVLAWIKREVLRRKWFFEQNDGNCRLMGSFAVRLSETALTWRHAVAPFAESMAHSLWSTIRKPARRSIPATRLTQRRRRQAKGGPPSAPAEHPPSPPRFCQICGAVANPGHRYCVSCAPGVARANLIEVAKRGRIATHSSTAEARRGETQRRQALAKAAWNPADKPDWLNEKTYMSEVMPQLTKMTVPTISSTLGISKPYAADLRLGKRIHILDTGTR